MIIGEGLFNEASVQDSLYYIIIFSTVYRHGV